MPYHAIPCNTMQYHTIQCNTMQYHAIQCNTMQYHAIPCNTMQYHAIPCNTMQYNAIPCNTMQYHASLITADGAYHCPVGSIMAIFEIVTKLILQTRTKSTKECLTISLRDIMLALNKEKCLNQNDQVQPYIISCSNSKQDKDDGSNAFFLQLVNDPDT